MKKIIRVLTVGFMLIILSFNAFADVLWEPINNTFYDKHREELRTVGRSYRALEDTKAYNEPGGAAVSTVPAGTEMHINFVWYDDKDRAYGITSKQEYDEKWVNLSAFELVYDCEMFMEQYAEEISDYYDENPLVGEIGVAVYEYPLCGKIGFTTDDVSGATIAKVYTDSYGRQWGYISYYHGIRNAWICLDSPQGVEEKETQQVPEGYTALPRTPSDAPEDDVSLYVKVCVIALAVIAISFTAYFLIIKKFR